LKAEGKIEYDDHVDRAFAIQRFTERYRWRLRGMI